MRKILRALALALALCLLLLTLRAFLPPVLMRRARWGLTALEARGGAETLFIGSSMFGKGLSAELLPEDSWILAYNGTQPVLAAWETETLLRRGVKPAMLVFDLYAYSAGAEPSLSDDRILFDLSPAEKLSLARAVYGLRPPLSVLWQMFVSAGNDSLLAWPVYFRAVNASYLRGGRLQRFEGAEAEELEAAGVYGIAGEIHPAQEAALRRLAALCRENGVRLVFAETPKYRLTMENAGYRAMMDRLTALAREEGVPVIGAEGFSALSADAACFIDPIHLCSKGQEAYTRLLAEALARLP